MSSANPGIHQPTNLQVVGVSDMRVSDNRNDVLITYSLGSCVGVTAYDPEAHVGGLIHCMLPRSKEHKSKAADNPAMFVDTGVTELITALLALGAAKRRLIVKVAGGASAMDPSSRFRIGERNYTVLRKLLWKNDLMIAAERIGGTVPRTVTLTLDSGITVVKERGESWEL